MIFTDNNSSDQTWTEIQKLHNHDSRVRAFKFTQNIGFQNSIFYGFSKSRGAAVIQIDCDLQDPPELIVDFINTWKANIRVVYGLRKKRRENFALSLLRKIGYSLIHLLSSKKITRNAGDFRLIDREVVNELLKIKTPEPYIRGIISSMGYPEVGIPYNRDSRTQGKSKFGIINLIKFGITGVMNHSDIPLNILSGVGLLSFLSSIVGSVYFVIMRISHPETPRGFVSVYVLLLFGIGIVSIFLAIIGSYIKKIYKILQNEPVGLVCEFLDDAL